MQIAAILSDYDGTLCPTGSIRSQEQNIIPASLEDVLWSISEKIPVGIVSSKDFGFLHSKTKFAKMVSCIMGIETLILKNHKQGTMMTCNSDSFECDDNLDCIESRYLMLNNKILEVNSQLLTSLANDISLIFSQVVVERKFTSYKPILAGITIDWRHMEDWKSFKIELEPRLKKLIREKQRELPPHNRSKLHIQTYTTHPFIDVYAVKCNKGMAFDCITSKIPTIEGKGRNIIYLGDSENDNPAFRKTSISIGIHSDSRLNPKLSCKYNICFKQLPMFLKDLLDKGLQFSDNLVNI